MNDTLGTPEPTGPVAVEGVEVSGLPNTGSGGDLGSDLAFGLIFALLLVALIVGSYGAASWLRGRMR